MVAKKKTKKVARKAVKKGSFSSRAGSFYQKYKLGVNSALVVLIIFGGWFVYSLPRMQEKQDLVAKHEKLEAIADKISSIKTPTERKSERFCQYSSTKFGKGNLSCDVATRLRYKGVSIAEASSIKNSIASGLSLVINNENGPSGSITDFEIDSNKIKHQSFSSNLSQGLDKCSLGYAYDLGEHPDKILYVSLTCYKSPAKAEHFPLEK